MSMTHSPWVIDDSYFESQNNPFWIASRDVLPLVNDLHVGIITSLHLHLSIIDRKNHSFPKGLSKAIFPWNPDFKNESSSTVTYKKILTFLRVIGYKGSCRTKVTYQNVGHTLEPHLKDDLYFTVCFMKTGYIFMIWIVKNRLSLSFDFLDPRTKLNLNLTFLNLTKDTG